jgi:hypothetical protein
MADPFADIGAGVSDIFAGFADETKAQGDLLEAQCSALPQKLTLGSLCEKCHGWG